MINEMIAFHYVLNVYHVNSISGIEDINRYSELPHVLLGHGSTYRVHPYWGHEDYCDIFRDNYVWSKLYDDGMNTEEINTPLIDSNQTNRTYIDIIAEGVDYSGRSRRVRVIFKIIDGYKCELWWLNGDLKDKYSLTVIDNYKRFCELTKSFYYLEQFNQENMVNPESKEQTRRYEDMPYNHNFTYANLFHRNIVPVMNKIIQKDHMLDYAIHF